MSLEELLSKMEEIDIVELRIRKIYRLTNDHLYECSILFKHKKIKYQSVGCSDKATHAMLTAAKRTLEKVSET